MFAQLLLAASSQAAQAPQGIDQLIANWVPGGVMSAAALVLGRMWFVQLLQKINDAKKSADDALKLAESTKTDNTAAALAFDRVMAKLEQLERDVQGVAVKLAGTATNDGLGRMGDRMDGRITNVAERVAVLEGTAKGRIRK